MKMTDKELEELVYSVLRRCPHSMADLDVARFIVGTIIEAEILELSDLKVAS